MRNNVNPTKYDFLDGLRACAMLNVLFFHALTMLPGNRFGTACALLTFLRRYSLQGQVGVVIFIVLSGYCLMLPVLRAPDDSLRGGIRGFLQRRAARILPGYYAVLFLCIAIACGMTALSERLGSHLGDYSAVLTVGPIVTHLLMIQNLWFDTAFTLNGAMWSVATEWQIYVVFALTLLPLWRRFGILFVTATAFLVGVTPGIFLPPDHNFDWARPWYLGLFAIGMLAACADFRPQSRDLVALGNIWRRTVPFLTLPRLVAVAFLALLCIHLTRRLCPSWWVDLLIATATALLISALINSAKRDFRIFVPIRAFLEHPYLVALAGFSYTAYLIQNVIYKGTMTLSTVLHLSPSAATAVNVFLGIPLILLASYGLAQYIERPFLARRPAQKKKSVIRNETQNQTEPALT